jgi:hypothetical protein
MRDLRKLKQLAGPYAICKGRGEEIIDYNLISLSS